MNIAFISYPSLELSAGGERWLTEVSTRMSASGYSVSILTSTYGENRHNSILNRLCDASVEYCTYNPLMEGLSMPTVRSFSKIASFISHQDAIYFVHFGGGIELAVALSNLLTSTPTIVGFHSKFENRQGSSAMSHIYDSLFGPRGIRFMRKADAFHVINKSDRDFLLRIGLSPIFTVPNGVDTKFFTPTEKAESFTILYVGRLIATKGVRQLKRIWHDVANQIIDLRLVIIGEGALEAELRNDLSDDRVMFMGFVEDENVKREWMSKSHVLLFPSPSEAFGLVALEALSSGTPVMCWNIEPLNSLIKTGYNGFLSDDINDFSKHILDLSDMWKNDEASYFELCKNARFSAVKCDWDSTIVPKLNDIFNNVVDSCKHR